MVPDEMVSVPRATEVVAAGGEVCVPVGPEVGSVAAVPVAPGDPVGPGGLVAPIGWSTTAGSSSPCGQTSAVPPTRSAAAATAAAARLPRRRPAPSPTNGGPV